MSQFEVADNNVAADTDRASSAYLPPLQRTEGQLTPIGAHGGLSYMSFDRGGDAGTAAAIQDALAEIAASNPYPDPWRGRCGPDDYPRASTRGQKGDYP